MSSVLTENLSPTGSIPTANAANTASSAPSARSLAPAWQALFTTWPAGRNLGAFVALAFAMLALIVQITLLSGWHLGSRTEQLPLGAANAVVVSSNGEARFEFLGQPAVATMSAISLETAQVTALNLSFDQIPPNTTLTLGWLSSRDLRRPANTSVALPPSTTPVSHRVLLRGHPMWRDNATRLAIALIAPQGSAAVTLQTPRIVSATPLASTALALASWSGDPPLAPRGTAERVLPVALWLSLAGVATMLTLGFALRQNPTKRAHAIVGSCLALTALIALATLFAPFAWALNTASWAWIAAALAIIATARPWRAIAATRESLERFSAGQHDLIAAVLSLGLASLACWLGGVTLGWVMIVVLFLLIAHRFSKSVSRLLPLLFVAPALWIAAMAQRFIAAPIDADALRDPSGDVATLLARAVAVPALIATFIAAHRVWPSALSMPRRDAAAGLAAWIALIGLVAAFALPSVSRSALVNVGALWLMLPLGCCVALFLLPAFCSQTSERDAAVAVQKTEADLSAVVRSLFDGASGSFDNALELGKSSSALAPLKRMQEIAPASLITHTAHLRYALASKTLAPGASHYQLLLSKPHESLNETQRAALVQYAHLTGDHGTVVKLAPALPPTIDTTRKLAHAQLFFGGDITAAEDSIATLSSHPERAVFAREIAELHLLRDDFRSAQQSMVETGIALDSLAGQCYITRLALRATDGAAYEKKINDNAMWHPDVGVAHAAVAELLQRRGNLAGARARLLLALKLDAGLWPLAMRQLDIERALGITAAQPPQSEAAQAST